MRVIAGIYKGRRLVSPEGEAARPTTDRVKEALFGVLQFEIEGKRVLDAFAGSGALGIEALSRGAAHADFIERDPQCLKALADNLKTIGDQHTFRVLKGDAFAVMSALTGQYDLLLLDPPYDAGYYEPALRLAHESGILAQGAAVAMECRRKFDFLPPMEYNFRKRRDYGDISLIFLEYGV
jgi:16S rRNA (guanine(966)-N(2))-methyltransferase RsmD